MCGEAGDALIHWERNIHGIRYGRACGDGLAHVG